MTPEIPNGFYRISIKALVTDDQGRFLLAKEESGTWELPGGGLDFGETPHECIRRELREEMGLTAVSIENTPSYFVTAQTQKGVHISNLLYHTKVENLDFTPSDECTEIRFFTAQEALAESHIFSNVRAFAQQYAPLGTSE